MKLLLIIFLFVSNISYSQEEDKLVVSTVKEKEIETALSKNPELQDCKKKKGADQDQCITDLVNSMDEKQLEAIAKDLGSSAYEVDGGAKADSIKKFMESRIEKIIYGDQDKDPKKQKTAVVGHNTYREIYKSQLGKNMFLDLNSYCLENLGVGTVTPDYMIGQVDFDKDKNIKSIQIISADDLSNKGTYATPADIKEFWTSKVNEYTKSTPGSSSKVGKRTVDDIKKLKEVSINRYADPATMAAAKSSSSFCQSIAIEKMCNYYKCKTQFDNLSQAEITSCSNDYDISSQGKTSKGQIACSLLKRLESYKMTLQGIKKQEDYYKEADQNIGFGGALEAIDTEYSDIDKMTSISSRELVNEAEAIKNSNEEAKSLEEECQDGNTDEKCLKTVAGISQEDEEGLALESKIANEVYRQRLSKLGAADDKEEFRKFLEENNLIDKYGKDVDTIPLDELAKIVSNDYASKRDALKNEMIEKYRATKASPAVAGQTDAQASLTEKVDELKEEKSYIETMFEYNNIVTSYLDLTLEKQENGRTVKESAGSFDQNRKNELEAIKKYAKDDEDAMKDYENYQQMFNDKESSQSDSGKSADDIDFLGFIDGVLGVK